LSTLFLPHLPSCSSLRIQHGALELAVRCCSRLLLLTLFLSPNKPRRELGRRWQQYRTRKLPQRRWTQRRTPSLRRSHTTMALGKLYNQSETLLALLNGQNMCAFSGKSVCYSLGSRCLPRFINSRAPWINLWVTIVGHTMLTNVPPAKQLFAFLDKYKPETRAEKKERLLKRAKEIASLKEGEKPQALPSPHFVKYGINHVTSLVESKDAKLLVIAHDVEPVEVISLREFFCCF